MSGGIKMEWLFSAFCLMKIVQVGAMMWNACLWLVCAGFCRSKPILVLWKGPWSTARGLMRFGEWSFMPFGTERGCGAWISGFKHLRACTFLQVDSTPSKRNWARCSLRFHGVRQQPSPPQHTGVLYKSLLKELDAAFRNKQWTITKQSSAPNHGVQKVAWNILATLVSSFSTRNVSPSRKNNFHAHECVVRAMNVEASGWHSQKVFEVDPHPEAEHVWKRNVSSSLRQSDEEHLRGILRLVTCWQWLLLTLQLLEAVPSSFTQSLKRLLDYLGWMEREELFLLEVHQVDGGNAIYNAFKQPLKTTQ